MATFPSDDTRFRSLTALAIVATVVVGLVAFRLWPDSANAEAEFARATRAVAGLQRFRYEQVALGGAQYTRETVELDCPSRQRRVVYEPRTEMTYEYRFVDGVHYRKSPDSEVWRTSEENVGELAPQVVCDQLARGGGGPFPPYAMLLKRGFATRGEIKPQADGSQCREWTVKIPQMGIADDSESFCLDTITYLPAYRVTARTRYTFSAYNGPFTIEAPAGATPYP